MKSFSCDGDWDYSNGDVIEGKEHDEDLGQSRLFFAGGVRNLNWLT